MITLFILFTLYLILITLIILYEVFLKNTEHINVILKYTIGAYALYSFAFLMFNIVEIYTFARFYISTYKFEILFLLALGFIIYKQVKKFIKKKKKAKND